MNTAVQATRTLDQAAEALKDDPAGFEPQNEGELRMALATPLYRLSNLYKIIIKDEDEDAEESEGLVITFSPNAAQWRLICDLHYRNLILKARQLGFTTFVAILFLDYSLFGPGNTRAGIIAHTDEDAALIFRDKVQFAYDNLPDDLQRAMPLSRRSARELLFEHNNSSVRVSTSMRSGTIQYLHISEYGKICARFPHRAHEIVTGTLPTVPSRGIIFIESTAEGRAGDFYDKSQRAAANYEAGKKLTRKDYAFHFYPWYDEPSYQMSPRGVIITEKDHDYFDEIEAKQDVRLSIRQRAWYVATRDEEFSGRQEMMWQEYPSTWQEAFQRSTDGHYLNKVLARARQDKRILETLPVIPSAPCWTCWDIGSSDGTAIWVVQPIGHEWRCIRFYEAWNESYNHAVQWLQGLGLVFDRHYLPHDADHERQGERHNKSPRMMLEDLMPGQRFEVVPQIEDVNWGIQQLRDVFPYFYFDETECKEGIIHLEAYRKKWSEQLQTWSDKPDKTGGHSEAPDALRQLAQAYYNGQVNVSRGPSKKKAQRSWKTV